MHLWSPYPIPRPYVTIVGARKAPLSAQTVLSNSARRLTSMGYAVLTGDAKAGGDVAAREGADDALLYVYRAVDCTPQAMEIAAQYHGGWHKIKSDFVRRLHGRNSFQVLGPLLNQTPIGLLCWTPDGCTTHADRSILTGGTGTAISIANMHEVPIANIRNQDMFNIWRNFSNG